MIEIYKDLRKRLSDIVKNKYDINLDKINLQVPQDRNFGDISTTIPFVLASKLKRKPFEISNEIAKEFEDDNRFSEIRIANGGYINFYFDKEFLINYLSEKREIEKKDKKVIVEHTSINPNKSAHIGHLRNSCIGDTLSRIAREYGYEVEIHNYIDDTGIQVADVVWGLIHYKKMNLEEIKRIENLESYLWELYIEVSDILNKSEEYKKQRDELHKKMEERKSPEFEISSYVSEIIMKSHIKLMDRLGIRYDLLVKESDIIYKKFFDKTAELLKSLNIMYLSKDEDKKGCWVIRYEKENIEKIIIRSNNTSTYIAKDLAYTFWKFGLLDDDFSYVKTDIYKDKELYSTDSIKGEKKQGFGDSDIVFNVIDYRQSYLQNIIKQVIESIDKFKHKDKSFNHFGYEMVALSHNCVKEMGFKISDEAKKKPYVEVSGRKGIAIKAEDLIDMLIKRAKNEILKRNKEINDDDLQDISKKIAIGALRYFMIKYNSNSVIVFDFDEVLNFEGDTGPYLQYSVVRLNSIFSKISDKLEDLKYDINKISEEEMFFVRDILVQILDTDTKFEMVINSKDVSIIANHIYTIAQKTNHYYHNFPVISENNRNLKNFRIKFLSILKDNLTYMLNLIGIVIPKKM